MKKIVVVDDDQELAEMLGLALEQKGYKTFIRKNGNDALKLIADVIPDMVILDIIMPEVNGMETLKRLKSISGLDHMSIILMSGSKVLGNSLIKGKSEQYSFISKPFSTDVFLKKVDEILEGESLDSVQLGT